MILAWMMYASLVAVAAGAAAWAIESAARALGRSTRFVWLAAMAFSVLWPLWRLASTLLRVGDDGAALSRALLPPVVVAAQRGIAAALVERLTIIGARASVALVILWLLASALLLLRLVLGMRALAQRGRDWMAQLVDGVPVLIAPDTGPAVVGVRRPGIVIPDWTLTLDPKLRALVLSHELEHVRARDTALRLLGALLPALLPWNPALWWQASRLALALEVDCDARVLRDGARRDRYGLLLVAIAQRQSLTMLAPALSEPTSQLERRIIVMQRPLPRRPMLFALTLAAGGTTALALACSVPTPNAPASADTKGTPVEAAAQLSRAPAVSPTRVSPNQAFREFQVEKRVTPLPGSARPRYPDALRKQHVEGAVLAQFVVNPTGQPDVSTFKVLTSDNVLFTSAVKSALAGMRFKPAEVGGRPVRQVVELPFQFSLSR
jgi:bla regulator protein blaR1